VHPDRPMCREVVGCVPGGGREPLVWVAFPGGHGFCGQACVPASWNWLGSRAQILFLLFCFLLRRIFRALSILGNSVLRFIT
jgi:hypothetical protein